MRFPLELRQVLLRVASRNGQSWTGKTTLSHFFGGIFDLKSLPSTDSRFQNAAADMWQHTENNDDWSEEDVLSDERFDPRKMTDQEFELFLNQAFSADSRSGEELSRFLSIVEPVLVHGGFRLARHETYGVFEGYKVTEQPPSTEAAQPDRSSMRPSQRMALMDRIGSELQARFTHNEITAYLGNFTFPRPTDEYRGNNSKRLFATHVLQHASPAVLVEIAQDLEIGMPGKPNPKPPANWRDHPSRFRLFVSHIAEHKDKATRLKKCLEPYAIDAFVAHEDIFPTLEWQPEIEKALNTMDAFLAIHTPGFSKSIWTQQEIGFAVARGVKIISFQMGEDPTGFISKHQALPRRNRTAEEIAVEIDAILSKDELTAERLRAAKQAAGVRSLADEIPF